ncbi:GNAT family N-acetyltransferase [Actinokineospora sp. 24-640]
MDTTPTTWRLRVRLDDRPGALARVATRLAARDCNVLGLAVLPVPGGVVDEIVVSTPPGVAPATLIEEIRAEGGHRVGITRADVRHLVDGTTSALRAAAAALRDPIATADAVRTLLGADSVVAVTGTTPESGTHPHQFGGTEPEPGGVEPVPGTRSRPPGSPEPEVDSAEPRSHVRPHQADDKKPEPGGVEPASGAWSRLPGSAEPTAGGAEAGARVRLRLPDGTVLEARRGWAPFTEVELARVAAFGELLVAGDAAAAGPSAVLTRSGAGVVLRQGTPADSAAVVDLHSRCSAQTLFTRYHAGVRTLPRRWLHRLLQPPRGRTLLAVCGSTVIGMAQVIRTNDPAEAEISVLVEDSWQGQGLGAALITRLGAIARAAGHERLVAWCLSSEAGFERAATASGLPVTVRREDGMVRVELAVGAGAREPGVVPATAH